MSKCKKIISKDDMYIQFKKFFRDDLLGCNPDFRIVVSGGYGIKTILEDKHHIYNKIKTGDLDLTVGTQKPYECFKYLYKKVEKFVNYVTPQPSDFNISVLDLHHSLVPIFNYHRDFIIMIDYKGDEFIDIAITDMKITLNMIDRNLSIKVGLPIKTEEYYMKEFMTLVYMENVPNINDYVYYKRNPITGKFPTKGQKDIRNSKLMCNYVKKKRYTKYCKLLHDITIKKLSSTSKVKRDKYFKELKPIVI